LGKRLRNDLFCVEWDVKPQLSQSISFLFYLFFVSYSYVPFNLAAIKVGDFTYKFYLANPNYTAPTLEQFEIISLY